MHTTEDLINYALNFIDYHYEESTTDVTFEFEIINSICYYFKTIGIEPDDEVYIKLLELMVKKHGLKFTSGTGRNNALSLKDYIGLSFPIEYKHVCNYQIKEERDGFHMIQSTKIETDDFYYYNPTHRKDRITDILEDLEKDGK